MLVFLFAIGGINYEPRNTPNTLKMILFRVFRVFSGKKINPVNPVKKLCVSVPLCLCVKRKISKGDKPMAAVAQRRQNMV